MPQILVPIVVPAIAGGLCLLIPRRVKAVREVITLAALLWAFVAALQDVVKEGLTEPRAIASLPFAVDLIHKTLVAPSRTRQLLAGTGSKIDEAGAALAGQYVPPKTALGHYLEGVTLLRGCCSGRAGAGMAVADGRTDHCGSRFR